VLQNGFSPTVLSTVHEERIPRSTFNDNFQPTRKKTRKTGASITGRIGHDHAEKKRELNSFETAAWHSLGSVLSFQDFNVFSHGRINVRIMEKSFNFGDGDIRLDLAMARASRIREIVKCAF